MSSKTFWFRAGLGVAPLVVAWHGCPISDENPLIPRPEHIERHIYHPAETSTIEMSVGAVGGAMQDRIGVAKVSDGEDGEQFWIVYINAEKVARGNGYFQETSGEMTEAEVREFFEKGRQPAAEVEAMFSIAREQYAKTKTTAA